MSHFVFPKLAEQSPLRAAITEMYRMNEEDCVETLLKAAELPQNVLDEISALAHKLVIGVRQQRIGKGGIDAFMYEYDLSGEEGIALMCLAEAMLRIPDSETIDRLIRDKVMAANWKSHLGSSESIFVNASSWGLMLTGKVLQFTEVQNQQHYFGSVLSKLVERLGEPVIRKALKQAMKILSFQFVMGSSIKEALKRSEESENKNYRFSYDMLGEAARTAADADRYYETYHLAIEAVGKSANQKGIIEGPGVSVKLSALHPRFEFAQQEKAVPAVIERLLALAQSAQKYNIGLTVDMEEADRLDITLDVIEAVSFHPSLRGWNGLGLAIQAYQKRTFVLIDWLKNLAQRSQRRFMLRLVKGAYWDYEIKDSQVKGLEDYPVFTRKVTTDVSYIACAKKIIAAGDLFFPQFGTHNAYTVAAIMTMMGERRDFEFQCLKGMGRALYDPLVRSNNIPCRIYAPVGKHKDLLPYLVRRLLENGANTSFVNRIIDENTPIEKLIAHPMEVLKQHSPKRNPKIPLPRDIYGPLRKNSKGIDLSNIKQITILAKQLEQAANEHWRATPLIGKSFDLLTALEVVDPSNHKNIIGSVINATQEDLDIALTRATKAAVSWNHLPVSERAVYLEKVAHLFEQNQTELMAIIIREAGKTILDAIGEVREAVDFCRYYASVAREVLVPKKLPGPTGETNELHMHGRGVILSISPWNFPLAIFTGQIAAALVAGNCVIAKPAEQTPLIAAKAVELMHKAGIPSEVIQLLPGEGSVIGAAAVADERVSGVVFTGSTETAQIINRSLANRANAIVPFIAETGGQNAIIVDSSALAEQVVMDVVSSAFNSAGQRCSADRILFLQEEIADYVIEMLKGAMAELQIGDPGLLSTDIGPVIDNDAKKMLEAHAKRMAKEGKLIYEISLPRFMQTGTYFAPMAFEIDNLDTLEREVFGPILHVIRYKASELDRVIDIINKTGYGLTLGIHTRIDSLARYIQERVNVGNTYVNRNIIGAVVGVQPFGGEGKSGTGPKAGGPHYLFRLCKERTLSINTTAAGGNATLMIAGD